MNKEYCDVCGEPLEAGQIGKCDGCQQPDDSHFALRFMHECVAVYNPMQGLEGEPVLPTVYGFEERWTGGGCTAYGLTLPNGSELLITSEEGCYKPDLEDAQTALIGLYDAHGVELLCVPLGQIPVVMVEGFSYHFDGDQIAIDMCTDEGFEFLMYHPFTNPTHDQIREFIIQHGGGAK